MRIKRYLLLLLSFIGVLVSAKPAAACSPVPPEWWFIEAFTVEETALPEEIDLTTVIDPRQPVKSLVDPAANTFAAFEEKRGHLKISNTSSAPLYLIAQQNGEANQSVENLSISLPENAVPVHKLEPNQSVVLTVDALTELMPGLIDPNQQAYNRPVNIEPPASQSGQLMLVHNNRLLNVPLIINYRLNPNYTPNAFAGCTGVYLGLYLQLLLPVCFGVVVVAVIAFFGWQAWKGRVEAK